jgi:hypothetical protein
MKTVCVCKIQIFLSLAENHHFVLLQKSIFNSINSHKIEKYNKYNSTNNNPFSRMTDDTLNLNFEDWNQKVTPQVMLFSPLFNINPDPEPKTSTEWENLLAVANSDHLLIECSETVNKYRKGKVMKIQNNDNEINVKIAHIVLGFNYISKYIKMPWVLIFEDAKLIAETFHHKLDLTLTHRAQIFAMLVYYLRDENIQNKNKFLQILLNKLAFSMHEIERNAMIKYCEN